MAIKVKLKHSSTANKAPLPTDLDAGELALNTNAASPAAYIKDNAGNIVKLAGAGSVSTPAATATTAGIVQLADATAVTAGTAGRVVDAAQLKTVSDADDWTRTGTTLAPKTAGDVVTISAGTAALPGLTPVGDPNTGLWAPAADTLALSVKGGEALRIDGSGRLLIGTSSTASAGDSQYARLQVKGNTSLDSGFGIISVLCGTTIPVSGNAVGAVLFAGTTGNEFARIDCIADGTTGSGDYPGRLAFSTTADGAASPTERMRISSTGSLTITAVTSDAAGTHTIGDSGASPNTLRLYNATDSNNTGNRFLVCDAAVSILRAEIRSNGGLANYSANNANLSDRNVKKDITLAAGTWDCIKEWEIVNYRYKDQPDDADLNLGVIAQQVAESCPEVITIFQEAKEATEDKPAQEERLGVKEQQMYWMAIKALQEAMGRIEALETEVALLKAA